jgi:hypothetical protein
LVYSPWEPVAAVHYHPAALATGTTAHSAQAWREPATAQMEASAKSPATVAAGQIHAVEKPGPKESPATGKSVSVAATTAAQEHAAAHAEAAGYASL